MTHDEYLAIQKGLFAKSLADRLDEASRTRRF